MKQHIEDFLKYLESKENKKVPLVAKLLHPNKFSPITEEDLTVKGNLFVQNLKIESLPDNLKVGENLYLQGTDIKSLPDNLTIGGSLVIHNTKIESLPNNLKVEGYMYVSETPLGKRMTPKEIKQEIEQKAGYLKGYVQYF